MKHIFCSHAEYSCLYGTELQRSGLQARQSKLFIEGLYTLCRWIISFRLYKSSNKDELSLFLQCLWSHLDSLVIYNFV